MLSLMYNYKNLTNRVTFGKSLGREMKRKTLEVGCSSVISTNKTLSPGLPVQLPSLKREQRRAGQP